MSDQLAFHIVFAAVGLGMPQVMALAVGGVAAPAGSPLVLRKLQGERPSAVLERRPKR